MLSRFSVHFRESKLPLLLGLALASTTLVGAQEEPIAVGDPLDLRRAAREIGEDALLARIDAGEVQAIRAAAFVDAPEVVLKRLGEIALGDDPARAPAAASAGAGLEFDALDVESREVLPATLREAREPWAALEADESARADLRRLAGIVRGRIDAALLETPRE